MSLTYNDNNNNNNNNGRMAVINVAGYLREGDADGM